MDLNYLFYSNYKMFNSKTKEIIIEWECDDNAESLIAYWIGELFDEPVIKDETLRVAWEEYVATFERENDCSPGFEELESFIEGYDTSSWVAYEITSDGMACGPVSFTALYVVDKDVVVEEMVEEEDENPEEDISK